MQDSPFVQYKATERRNDYSLFTSAAKLGAFRELLAQPYFLTAPVVSEQQEAGVPVLRPVPFPASFRPPGNVQGAVYLKTFEAPTALALSLDGSAVPVLSTLPYTFVLSAAVLTPGQHTLRLLVKGAKGQILIDQAKVFTAQPQTGAGSVTILHDWRISLFDSESFPFARENRFLMHDTDFG